MAHKGEGGDDGSAWVAWRWWRQSGVVLSGVVGHNGGTPKGGGGGRVLGVSGCARVGGGLA